MASVVIRDVRKAFGLAPVIHGVTITIEDGQFVVLVGPSGCGKSTLLRMIAGLENITAGEIKIGDRVVNNLPPKERDVAMVFQNYALYPHMTVAANMAFSMKLRGAPKDEIEKRVKRAAEILGSAAIAGTLSAPALGRPASARRHGPRDRARSAGISVRRAVVEPRRQAARADAHRNQGTSSATEDTTVYVTHDQIEAMTMADKIVVMHDGRSSRSARRWSSTTGRKIFLSPDSSARRR